MTKEDFVIICGDFGGVWDYKEESREEKYLLDWLEEKPFTTLFVSGYQNKVDYIITHCGPQNALSVFSDGLFQADELTKYFLKLSEIVDFSSWFFGHYRDNRKILDRYFLLYEQIIRII